MCRRYEELQFCFIYLTQNFFSHVREMLWCITITCPTLVGLYFRDLSYHSSDAAYVYCIFNKNSIIRGSQRYICERLCQIMNRDQTTQWSYHEAHRLLVSSMTTTGRIDFPDVPFIGSRSSYRLETSFPYWDLKQLINQVPSTLNLVDLDRYLFDH